MTSILQTNLPGLVPVPWENTNPQPQGDPGSPPNGPFIPPSVVSANALPASVPQKLVSTSTESNVGEWVDDSGGGVSPLSVFIAAETATIAQSPAAAWVFNATTTDPVSAGGTLTSLPFLVGAGQPIVNQIEWYALPTFSGTLAVVGIELAVTNMDCTEVLVVDNANPLPNLTSGEGRGTWSDFGSTGQSVGTDLTHDGAGNISTTAGGVFVVQATVELLYTP